MLESMFNPNATLELPMDLFLVLNSWQEPWLDNVMLGVRLKLWQLSQIWSQIKTPWLFPMARSSLTRLSSWHQASLTNQATSMVLVNLRLVLRQIMCGFTLSTMAQTQNATFTMDIRAWWETTFYIHPSSHTKVKEMTSMRFITSIWWDRTKFLG